MKFSVAALSLSLLASVSAVTVRYDNNYDNAGQSLDTVACSDGENGLMSKGFNTFGDLPTFPNIGASQAVEGWDSASCGSCWNITYKGISVLVTAVDHADSGFNIAEKSLNKLTKGQASKLGQINATAK